MQIGSSLVGVALVFSAVLVLAGCETGGAEAAAAKAASLGRPGDSQIIEGHRLYVGRCTACHSPEPVLDYTLAEWRELMPEMADESKMNAAQERAVMAYVEAHF